MSLCIKGPCSTLYVHRDLYRHAANILLRRRLTSSASPAVLSSTTRRVAADRRPATSCDWMSESVGFEERDVVIGEGVNNHTTSAANHQSSNPTGSKSWLMKEKHRVNGGVRWTLPCRIDVKSLRADKATDCRLSHRVSKNMLLSSSSVFGGNTTVDDDVTLFLLSYSTAVV